MNSFIQAHYPNCLNSVKKYLPYIKDKVIIDVGSNIGLFSKAIAETTSYKHIHLFEPSKIYFDISKTILSNCDNITYNNFALGLENTTKILYKSNSGNIGWNTLYDKDPNQMEGFCHQMDQEKISVVKFDDYYKNINQLDFIKIDVEGYEKYVIEGSWDLITKFKPYLLIEVAWGKKHPDWIENEKTYEKLFSLGYKIVNFNYYTEDILFEPL